MAFSDQEALLYDPGFQVKVRQAMTKAALGVVGETPTSHVTVDSKRHALGVGILNGITSHEDAFRRAVAANPAITSSSTDSDVEFTVNSVFNDVAGVSGVDQA